MEHKIVKERGTSKAMKKVCVGDADSCGDLGRPSNFFATKESNEVSFDLKTWYKEGDLVYYSADGEKNYKSKISAIYDNGEILIENEMGTIVSKTGEMKIGLLSSGENIEYGKETILAVRKELQFSIDLKKWFGIGQKCIIKADNKIYDCAKIRNVFDDGKILVENMGKVECIDYNLIESIQDFFENTRYIVDLGSKKPSIVLSYAKKHAKTKIS